MEKAEVAKEFCHLAGRVADKVFKNRYAADCFCGCNPLVHDNNLWNYDFNQHIMDYIKTAVHDKMVRDGVWVLTWSEGDSGDPESWDTSYQRFLTKDDALSFVRENWEPADDITTALLAAGEWSETKGFNYNFHITLAKETITA